MTTRKRDNVLGRTPRYVSREVGAAELVISPETWDRWVEEGRLPSAAPGFPPSAPRWRWDDVDEKLRGKRVEARNAYVEAVAKLPPHGPAKERKRDAA